MLILWMIYVYITILRIIDINVRTSKLYQSVFKAENWIDIKSHNAINISKYVFQKKRKHTIVYIEAILIMYYINIYIYRERFWVINISYFRKNMKNYKKVQIKIASIPESYYLYQVMFLIST